VAVNDSEVIIKPHASNKERTIRRKEIEGAYQELMGTKEITRSDVRTKFSEFNPAYVVAILAALPGIEAHLSPIRLQMK
jgi:hypothetical protein